MNGHKYILFKNIFNDLLTDSKGEINMALHNYSEIVYWYFISWRAKKHVLGLIQQLRFTIKLCKIDSSSFFLHKSTFPT